MENEEKKIVLEQIEKQKERLLSHLCCGDMEKLVFMHELDILILLAEQSQQITDHEHLSAKLNEAFNG